MTATAADAGSATVTGSPQVRQLRRSGDDTMLAAVWIASGRDRFRSTLTASSLT